MIKKSSIFPIIFFFLSLSFCFGEAAKPPDLKRLLLSKEEAKDIGLKIVYKQVLYATKDYHMPDRILALTNQQFRCIEEDKYRNDPLYQHVGFQGVHINATISYFGSEHDAKRYMELVNRDLKNEITYKKDRIYGSDGKLSQIEELKIQVFTSANHAHRKEIWIITDANNIINRKSIQCRWYYQVKNFVIYFDAYCLINVTGTSKWALGPLLFCNTKEKIEKLKQKYIAKIAELTNTDIPLSDYEEISNNSVNITISATKEGFKSDFQRIPIDEAKIMKLNIEGKVYDDKTGKIIQNAKVILNIKGKEYITNTDKNGHYSYDVIINKNGSITINTTENLYLKQKPSKITAKVLSGELIANGKPQLIRLQISDKNGPVKNKVFFVSFVKEPITKNSSQVNYVKRPFVDQSIKTDGNGIAVFKLKALIADKKRLNRNPFIGLLFPVNIKLIIFDDEGGTRETVGEVTLSYKSPYPKIKRFTVPGNLQAGHWQTVPSRIEIEDPDSKVFNIIIKGKGKFKRVGTPIYTNGYKEYNYDKNVMEFYYASDEIGLDLNKQPDLWNELLETNAKNVLNVSFAILESWGLGVAQKSGLAIPGIPKKLTSEGVLSTGKIGATGLDYYAATLNLFKVKEPKDISGTDIADWEIGGVSLASDIYNLAKGISTGLGATLQVEAAKAIYENAKTVYNVYKKYQKINNAYKGVVFIPITLIVSDKDGHETMAITTCSVRIWKEN